MPGQVGKLRVLMDADYVATTSGGAGTIPLDPSSVYFRAAAAAVDLGLSLLEIHEGHRNLPDVGIDVITHREHSHIHPETAANLHGLADIFTDKLRESFPPLLLTNYITGQGFLRKMIKNLVDAGHEAFRHPGDHLYTRAFQDFMVLMAVTVAHELVHLWIGYLATSRDSPHTPVGVNSLASYYTGDYARNYGTDNHGDGCGDSGRVWEDYALGGTLEAFGEASNQLGAYQAGTLYCLDRTGAAREVRRSWIEAFLRRSQFLATIASFISNLRANVLVSAGNFRLPFLVEDDATTIAALRDSTYNMNEFRKMLVPREVREALQGGYEMPREITREDLRTYTEVRSYTIRGQQYQKLRRAATEPDTFTLV
ncbi:hypothetical protein GGR55DRAFT_676775 [Xylaria sp. FL0064]|nr:hypothetical protein GGR55DRAFT_676775 [Xylaria sp. FL0064]